jgi:hypothetical protein
MKLKPPPPRAPTRQNIAATLAASRARSGGASDE